MRSAFVQELATLESAAADSALASGVSNAHGIASQLFAKLIAFLTLYRAQSNGLVAATRDHSPDDFLNEMVAGLVLPQSAPTIELELAQNSPPFWFFDAYPVRLARETAVQNAIRFARSHVVVRARAEEGWLVLSVEDDGPGLGTGGPPSASLGTELCRSIPPRISMRGRPVGSCWRTGRRAAFASSLGSITQRWTWTAISDVG
jgi:signal transduction histidine kinase